MQDFLYCSLSFTYYSRHWKGDPIDYVVNTSGAQARKVKPIEGTVFCASEPGFSVVTASKKQLCLHMIDKKGNVIHTVSRTK